MTVGPARERLRRLLVPALLVLLGVAIGLGAAYIRPSLPTDAGPVLSELPDEPMDLEVVDGVGYATFFGGRIVRVAVDAGRVTWSPAAEGLARPRGLAMTDDTLYVVDVGGVPCVSEPGCPEDRAERERKNIAESNARVIAFPIQPDGSLGEPRTLLEHIPSVTRDHGANDLEVGPDGMLYLTVGGVDYLWTDPAALDTIDHPHLDWLGSVLRIDPTSGEAEVWATGLRNVYGLTFSPGGRLFGVDNDGPTLRGWRQEELIELTRGAHYGYPFEASFGPFDVRTGFPIYALEPGGHAGIAWVGDGVVAGSCGRIDRIPFIDRDGEYEVRSRVLLEVVGTLGGCVTALVPVDGGLLAAAFGASGVYFFPNR
ncbi:MAG: PQQ-dependent sugar dehydrogenase [Chloroflexota bacterium]